MAPGDGAGGPACVSGHQPPAGPLVVIKIGGGLTAIPGALDTACSAVAALGRGRRLVVVPGGGPFADAVREFDARVGASADAAHWMAILAMDQFAQVLAERIEGAVLVEEPGAIPAVLGAGSVVVLAPYRWLRAADVLPHSWNATSDSVAAFVAGALDAGHLVLIKPVGDSSPRPVDPCFETVLPADLPCTILPWDQLGELASRL